MKTTGGRDTFLLFIVLLIALGAVCYLFVIQNKMLELKSVKTDLQLVEQEKAEKDAIIQQAQELEEKCNELRGQLQTLEGKYLPDLYTDTIARKLYKYFEEAGLPYIVEGKNTPIEYETVTMSDGSASRNRAMHSSYTLQVSGTDGWLLTHTEGDDIPYQVFTTQLVLGNDPTQQEKPINKPALDAGITDVTQLTSDEYVGYDEFVKALKAIQENCPDYVKTSDIKIEDMGQGFNYYSVTIDVYAYDLIDRISKPNYDMDYLKWVGAEKITTGGLVGLPNYFVLGSPNYKVSPDSPLYNHFVSFSEFDFTVNRPFAAWTHWSYEWQVVENAINMFSGMDPVMFQLNLQYQIGMITADEYNAAVQYYYEQLGQEAPNNQIPNLPEA